MARFFLQNIGFIADTVLIDPEYWLVTKNNTTSKLPNIGSGDNIQVFPNPIQDRFNILMSNLAASSADIALYNSAGQLVYSKNISLVNGSEFLEIPSSNLASGVYTLKIQAGKDTRFVKKLLK